MKLQTIACAVAVATGGLFFTHAINEAIAATDTAPAHLSNHSTDSGTSAGFTPVSDIGRPSALFKYASGCQYL
jgi:hypothetical protein